MALQILVAHNGKTFELDCQSNTRIDVIQEALASLTGLAVNEQILICGGAKLDGGRSLSTYGLPSAQERSHVFLYNKKGLKPGSAPPEAEAYPEIKVEEIAEPSGHQTGHPLDTVTSPLIRALPVYERQFKHHLLKGQALWRASQERLKLCRQLVSEMRVQVLSIDSARQNVDIHYNYICKAQMEFATTFNQQRMQHEDLLSSFEADVERLSTFELHPSLRAGDLRTLGDCVPVERVRDWHASCSKSHASFLQKIGDLGSVFTQLQQSVEELFMTGPDIDVAQLEERLEDAGRFEEEETSILQSLSKDLQTVQRLVEDTVCQMTLDHSGGTAVSGGAGSSCSQLRPVDACAALDPMSDLHASHHLPKIEECDVNLERLTAHIAECKQILTGNVHAQLQSISILQSRIRDLRCKLTAFKEVMSRQASAFVELWVVRRVPSQYRACLAEVARRKAYASLYAGQAATLAEKMAHVRDREAARRDHFVRQQERFLPKELLQSMGLYTNPPQCEVSIPFSGDTEEPLEVSDRELQQVYKEAVPALRQGAGWRKPPPGTTTTTTTAPALVPPPPPHSSVPASSSTTSQSIPTHGIAAATSARESQHAYGPLPPPPSSPRQCYGQSPSSAGSSPLSSHLAASKMGRHTPSPQDSPRDLTPRDLTPRDHTSRDTTPREQQKDSSHIAAAAAPIFSPSDLLTGVQELTQVGSELGEMKLEELDSRDPASASSFSRSSSMTSKQAKSGARSREPSHLGAVGGAAQMGGAVGGGDRVAALEMENARLRAELAAHVALLAVMEPDRQGKSSGPSEDDLAGAVPGSRLGSGRGGGEGKLPSWTEVRRTQAVSEKVPEEETSVEDSAAVRDEAANAAVGEEAPVTVPPIRDTAVAQMVADALMRKDELCEMLELESKANSELIKDYETRIIDLETHLEKQSQQEHTALAEPILAEKVHEDSAGSTVDDTNETREKTTIENPEEDVLRSKADGDGSTLDKSPEITKILTSENTQKEMKITENTKTQNLEGSSAELEKEESAANAGLPTLENDKRVTKLRVFIETLESTLKTATRGICTSDVEESESVKGASTGTPEHIIVQTRNALHELECQMKQMETDDLENESGSILQSLSTLCSVWKSQLSRDGISQERSRSLLCYSSFELGMLAVFVCNEAGRFEAVSDKSACAHYYLATECAENFKSSPEGCAHGYIVGQIMRIEAAVAYGEDSSPTNMFGLLHGTQYHVLTICKPGEFDFSLKT